MFHVLCGYDCPPTLHRRPIILPISASRRPSKYNLLVTFDLTRMMIMGMRRTVENGSAFTLGARTVPERSRMVELTVLF